MRVASRASPGTSDGDRLKLRQLDNVVEEMSIAAGLPKPNVYVVPDPDPNAREHRPTWPSGRTNHYYFDLNRDWENFAQPESVAFWRLWRDVRPQLALDRPQPRLRRPAGEASAVVGEVKSHAGHGSATLPSDRPG